jgi:hypothetical protein
MEQTYKNSNKLKTEYNINDEFNSTSKKITKKIEKIVHFLMDVKKITKIKKIIYTKIIKM